MASQARTVELWDKLQPDGGVRKAVIADWSKLVETNREDGDDSLALAFPLSNAAAALVANGWAARIVGEDGTIREYLVYVITDDVNADTCELTCAGARARLNTATSYDGTHSASAATLLGYAFSGSGISFVTNSSAIAGTFTVTFSGDTVLSAVQKVAAAVDATLSPGAPPCAFSFVMTSTTVYTLTLKTTVTAGTAHLLSGKNIARLTRRRDTTDPTWPTTGYTVLVADLYRDQPANYPNDNLKPYETCRLEYVPMAIDTTIRIVSVQTDHRNSIGTVVELGTPKRRLQQTVVEQATAIAEPLPSLTITETVAATTTAFAFTALGAVSVNIDGAGDSPVTSPISGIARNAFGGARKQYLFTATLGGKTITETHYVEPQAPTTFGPTLHATATPSTTTTSIAYSGDSVQVSIDGAAFGSPVTATPLVVSRNVVGGADQTYTWQATKDGQTITSTVIVTAQVAPAPPPALIKATNSVFQFAVGTSVVLITVSWTLAYVPSGYQAKVYGRIDPVFGNWTLLDTTTTYSSAQSPHANPGGGGTAYYLAGTTYDGTGAKVFLQAYKVNIYSGSGSTLEATVEIATPFYGTVTATTYP